ncbi:hypothetical protein YASMINEVIRUS_1012 [Yasminevirus sp. GU-2018]|uniref:Uncharacterized protein n=1 Tax=Yasminevirus sp. GU-2018 TaxID=2420051 RepID=A0A5K0U8S0_9VIRU|nr:hypothetical protein YASMINEVIRUS_1012 [Yasminevirus sp. GU-2018]
MNPSKRVKINPGLEPNDKIQTVKTVKTIQSKQSKVSESDLECRDDTSFTCKTFSFAQSIPHPIRYITDEEYEQMVLAEEEYLKKKVAQGFSPLSVTCGVFTSHVHTDCDGRRYVYTYSF